MPWFVALYNVPDPEVVKGPHGREVYYSWVQHYVWGLTTDETEGAGEAPRLFANQDELLNDKVSRGLLNQRCLVIMDGSDDTPMVAAGIWNACYRTSNMGHSRSVFSFAIISDSNTSMITLPPETWETWIWPKTPVEEAFALL